MMSSKAASTRTHDEDDCPAMNHRPSKVCRVSMEGLSLDQQDHNTNASQERIISTNSPWLKRRVTLNHDSFVPTRNPKRRRANAMESTATKTNNLLLDNSAVEEDRIIEAKNFLKNELRTVEQQLDLADEMPRVIKPHTSLLQLADAATAIASETISVTPSEEEIDMYPSKATKFNIEGSQLSSEEIAKTKPATQRQQSFGLRMVLLQLFVQIVVFMAYVYSKQRAARLSFPNDDCIYVTGGGFSGFWFSMGRLRSIPNPRERNFVCYSAGCLASVASLSNSSMEELYDIASTTREQLLSGERHRYDIVEFFVDGLLEGADSEVLTDSLDRLHILTSVTDPQSTLPMARMQTPSDLRHLKTLLLQTTWIPQAIGSHFAHHGHLDGFFSAFQHPKCNDVIGLAWDFELRVNALNPNIRSGAVAKFWNMGLEYGL
jgi:hypothetical protein